jgi:hypothetical protein
MSGASHRDNERVIARLIGPAGPELSCDECFEQLDRYAELELAGADPEAAIPGMCAHLHGCAACAEDHDSLCTFLFSGDARAER